MLGGAHKHEAHERRLIEVEATDAFVVQERLKPLVSFGFGGSAPIEPLDGNLNPIDHVLHRFRDAFPAETDPHDRMSLGHPMPGAKEVRLVQRLAKYGDRLFDVDAGFSSADAVEEHSRLHRRQFVGVDYGSHGAVAGQAQRGEPAARLARRLPLSMTTAATNLGAGEILSMRQPQSSRGCSRREGSWPVHPARAKHRSDRADGKGRRRAP